VSSFWAAVRRFTRYRRIGRYGARNLLALQVQESKKIISRSRKAPRGQFSVFGFFSFVLGFAGRQYSLRAWPCHKACRTANVVTRKDFLRNFLGYTTATSPRCRIISGCCLGTYPNTVRLMCLTTACFVFLSAFVIQSTHVLYRGKEIGVEAPEKLIYPNSTAHPIVRGNANRYNN
jgi:hypothetical protein